MSIAYDATGAGFSGPLSSSTTFNHTAASGAYVIVGLSTDRAATMTVKWGGSSGTAMTLLGSIAHNNTSADGTTYLYGISGVSSGTTSVYVATDTAMFACADSVSYTGVSTVSGATTTSGSGTSLSQSATCTSGQVIVDALGWGEAGGSVSGAGTYTFSGGNNRVSTIANFSGNYAAALGMGDSTSSTSFTGSATSSVLWSGLYVVLDGSSGNVTVSPGGDNIVTTAGTLQLPGTPVTISPGGATISTTAGVPFVKTGPISATESKLSAAQDVTWLALGDSTVFGEFDDENEFGWVGRLANDMGAFYNANVVLYLWNYPTDTAYNSPVTWRTAIGSGRPTLTAYIGGWGGVIMSTLVANESAMFAPSAADLIFIQEGFNENAVFTSYYSTYINDLQTKYGTSTPIVCTTANATPSLTHEVGHVYLFVDIFNAITDLLIPGETLPLSPPLQASTAFTNVYELDTQQANLTTSDLESSGLHPNGQGYDKQANWMLAYLAPNIPLVVEPGAATISTTAGTPLVSVPGAFHGHGALSVSLKGAAFPAFAGHGALSVTDRVSTHPAFTGHGAFVAAAGLQSVAAHAQLHGTGVLSAAAVPPGAFVAALDLSSQGTVEGTVIFHPVPASAGASVAIPLVNGRLTTFVPAITGGYLVAFAGVTLNGAGGNIESFEFTSPISGGSLNLNTVASPPPSVIIGTSPPNVPANSAVWSASALTLSRSEERLSVELDEFDDDWLITTDNPRQATERRQRLLTANVNAKPAAAYSPVDHRQVHGEKPTAAYPPATSRNREVHGSAPSAPFPPVTSANRNRHGNLPGPAPYPPATSRKRDVGGGVPVPDPYPHRRQPLKAVEDVPAAAYTPVTSQHRHAGPDPAPFDAPQPRQRAEAVEELEPVSYEPTTSRERNTIRIRERRRRVKKDG